MDKKKEVLFRELLRASDKQQGKKSVGFMAVITFCRDDGTIGQTIIGGARDLESRSMMLEATPALMDYMVDGVLALMKKVDPESYERFEKASNFFKRALGEHRAENN